MVWKHGVAGLLCKLAEEVGEIGLQGQTPRQHHGNAVSRIKRWTSTCTNETKGLQSTEERWAAAKANKRLLRVVKTRGWVGASPNGRWNSVLFHLQPTCDFSKELWSQWVEKCHLPPFKMFCSFTFPSYRYWSNKENQLQAFLGYSALSEVVSVNWAHSGQQSVTGGYSFVKVWHWTI